MQFDFSDEQKELRDSVGHFFERECPVPVVRAVLDSEAGHDAELWRKTGEVGFLATAIPEAYGGVGAGYLELCVVAEEAGRVLAPLPTLSSIYQATEYLLIAGSEDQKLRWLPKLAVAEAIGTVALNEGVGEMRSDRVAARVAKGRLTGEKLPVPDGMAADFAIVLARDEDGDLAHYLVELTAPGVARRLVDTIDPSRKYARLVFDGAEAEPLGKSKRGWPLVEQVRDRAAVPTAFEQLGGAERALEAGRDYALERYAFGRPIATFQAVKHQLADVYVANELARSNAYYGAWALSSGNAALPVAAASARVAATRAFQLAAATNIQVHGGMGFTWEFDCHLYYRRAAYLALALGGPSFWEDRLIEHRRSAAARGESP